MDRDPFIDPEPGDTIAVDGAVAHVLRRAPEWVDVRWVRVTGGGLYPDGQTSAPFRVGSEIVGHVLELYRRRVAGGVVVGTGKPVADLGIPHRAGAAILDGARA